MLSKKLSINSGKTFVIAVQPGNGQITKFNIYIQKQQLHLSKHSCMSAHCDMLFAVCDLFKKNIKIATTSIKKHTASNKYVQIFISQNSEFISPARLAIIHTTRKKKPNDCDFL